MIGGINSDLPFAAAQAAQKTADQYFKVPEGFAAAQAAQKSDTSQWLRAPRFAAAQAAQK